MFDLISKKKVPAATPWRGGGWWLGLRRVSAPVGVRLRPPPLGCAAAWGVLIAPPFECRLKQFILSFSIKTAFFSCYISAAGPSDRSPLRKGEKGGREEKRKRKKEKEGGRRRRRIYDRVPKHKMNVNVRICCDELNDTDIGRHRGAEGADPPPL